MEIYWLIIGAAPTLLIGGYLAFRLYSRKTSRPDSEPYAVWSEYINSRKWEDLRRQALKRADYKCELCGAPYKAVHHIRYPKRHRADHIDNLLAVCEQCHAKLHGIRDETVLSDKGTLYSEEVRTGSHTYFFRVKTSIGRKYLQITESGKRGTRHIEVDEDILGKFMETMKKGLSSLKSTAALGFEKKIYDYVNDRTYFFEIKLAVNESRYLKIMESGRRDNTVIERDQVIFFEDEAVLVLIGLDKTLGFIHTNRKS